MFFFDSFSTLRLCENINNLETLRSIKIEANFFNSDPLPRAHKGIEF